MKVTKTDRGFEWIEHPAYLPVGKPCKLVGQSSELGDYPDSMARPGSSFLWFGEHHHLTREEVAELRDHLTAWLETGSLQTRQRTA